MCCLIHPLLSANLHSITLFIQLRTACSFSNAEFPSSTYAKLQDCINYIYLSQIAIHFKDRLKIKTEPLRI